MKFFERWFNPEEDTRKIPSSERGKTYVPIEQVPDQAPDPAEALMRKDEKYYEKKEAEAEQIDRETALRNPTAEYDLTRPASFNIKKISEDDLADVAIQNGATEIEHMDEAAIDKKLADDILARKGLKDLSLNPEPHKSARNDGRKPMYKDKVSEPLDSREKKDEEVSA